MTRLEPVGNWWAYYCHLTLNVLEDHFQETNCWMFRTIWPSTLLRGSHPYRAEGPAASLFSSPVAPVSVRYITKCMAWAAEIDSFHFESWLQTNSQCVANYRVFPKDKQINTCTSALVANHTLYNDFSTPLPCKLFEFVLFFFTLFLSGLGCSIFRRYSQR